MERVHKLILFSVSDSLEVQMLCVQHSVYTVIEN